MNKINGFTLIEVAIVLLIITLALGSVLGPISSQLKQSKINETEEQLEEIKQAILAFAIVNNRLPCPDIDLPRDGSENPNCAPATSVGGLPTVELGLTKRLDAWGGEIIYRVTSTFADTLPAGAGSPCVPAATANPNVSFEICSPGDINVFQEATLTTPVANNLPVILISMGQRKNAADTSAEETENTNGDTFFVSREYTDANANTPFNDQVVWISAPELVSAMVKAGKLP